MSYTPGFAPDAESQWRALDTIHQELALDELERLCASPPAALEHVGTVVYDEAGMRHHVFVHVVTDHRRRLVTVIGIGHGVIPAVEHRGE